MCTVLRLSDAYVSVNYAIISSDNGLPPVRRHAIIWTNAGLLLIRPIHFSGLLIESQTFSSKKNAFENVVCRMAAILFRPQGVNPQTS